ncbi:MAG: hypothetical protein ABW026_17895, partial [Microvirga sp.]
MPAFRRLERARRTAARLALVLVVLFAAEILGVPAARAQSDIAFGPIEDAQTVLAASQAAVGLSRPFLASWFHDPLGTVVTWIMGMAEETRPHVIPGSVVLHVIPGHSSYRYAV